MLRVVEDGTLQGIDQVFHALPGMGRASEGGLNAWVGSPVGGKDSTGA